MRSSTRRKSTETDETRLQVQFSEKKRRKNRKKMKAVLSQIEKLD